MWPWGHLALGYLFYAGYCAVVRRRAPSGWPVVAMAFGTQFPDVVDKPLAYWFGVLPEGRTLTHSAVILIPVCLSLIALAWYFGRGELGVSFSIGWGSHLVGDSVRSLLDGTSGSLTFLLWPLRPAPDYDAPNFYFHARQLVSSLQELTVNTAMNPLENLFVLQLWLAAGVFLLWLAQDMPPTKTMGRWIVGVIANHRV